MNLQYIQCNWVAYNRDQYAITSKPCTHQALKIIIAGCLNGHIHETILCGMHFDDWEEDADEHRIPCPHQDCRQNIDTWEKIPLQKATFEWHKQHLR